MKFFAFFLYFLMNNTFSTSVKFATPDQLSVVYELYKKAGQCRVLKEKSSYQLCSGLILNEQLINEYKKWDLKQCFSEISKLGFKVEKAKLGHPLSEEILKTSKRALVYYKEKTVYYLPSINKSDCFHELIHVLQRDNKSSNYLNYNKRKIFTNALLVLIEKKVKDVEKLEKAKKKKTAAELGIELQKWIKLLKKTNERFHLLDEIEIYQLYYFYAKDLGLSTSQREMALTNLIQYQKALPWELKITLKRVARKLHLQKIKMADESKGSLSDPVQLLNDFNSGKISRESFEGKSYKNLSIQRKEKLKSLKGLDRKLFVGGFKDCTPMSFSSKKIYFHKNLIFLDKESRILLDTGAQDSLISNKVYNREIHRICGSKKLAFHNKTVSELPVLENKKDVGSFLWDKKDFDFITYDNLPGGLIGLVGLSAFKKGLICLDIKNKKIYSCPKDSIKSELSFRLDFKEIKADALEFYCSKNIKVRLDTGSQVYGDIPEVTTQIPIGGDCKKLSIDKAQLIRSPFDALYFDRDVMMNLGTPWLMQFKMVKFDLNNNIISFEK
ncbi:hypothetical protein OAT67_06625 [Bacteriovoracaceae bacterium]|nr:hypothetical protein [Bacteriovoracaceae bacterium]